MNHQKWAVGLVEQLTKLADPDNPNRAALAHLRRGLDASPDYVLGRVGWLFRSVPDETHDRHALDAALLAAGLFAWTKGECRQVPGINFGEAFGSNLNQEDKEKREKRFVDLLDTSREELAYKLRQAVSLIAKDAVGLDWTELIRHLAHWDHPDRWVQKEWARGFWSWTPEEVPEGDDSQKVAATVQ